MEPLRTRPDFELLFGAAKLNIKIVDLPVRYRRRVYGETNIRRWSDGWLLLSGDRPRTRLAT